MKLEHKTKLTINTLEVTKCGSICNLAIYSTLRNDILFLVDESNNVLGSILLVDVSPDNIVVTEYESI
jgi:hypothetical protein